MKQIISSMYFKCGSRQEWGKVVFLMKTRNEKVLVLKLLSVGMKDLERKRKFLLSIYTI